MDLASKDKIVQKSIENSTFPSFMFPELIKRHLKMEKNQINFFKQTHESYMYTFFYNSSLKFSKIISVNGSKGLFKSDVQSFDIKLMNKVDEEYFFSILKYAPIPFIFIPDGNQRIFADFCKGAFSFNNGILMDFEFANEVGVGFIGSDLLLSGKISVYYIGFIYEKFGN